MAKCTKCGAEALVGTVCGTCAHPKAPAPPRIPEITNLIGRPTNAVRIADCSATIAVNGERFRCTLPKHDAGGDSREDRHLTHGVIQSRDGRAKEYWLSWRELGRTEIKTAKKARSKKQA